MANSRTRWDEPPGQRPPTVEGQVAMIIPTLGKAASTSDALKAELQALWAIVNAVKPLVDCWIEERLGPEPDPLFKDGVHDALRTVDLTCFDVRQAKAAIRIFHSIARVHGCHDGGADDGERP